jgi:hypothetical protein
MNQSRRFITGIGGGYAAMIIDILYVILSPMKRYPLKQ